MFFEKLSLVTGGFDPIHSGHIKYFERAKDLSNYLVVGINTEEWLTQKKGQYFLSWKERAEIIRHLDMVDAVISWEDDELGSACGAIEKCLDISETVVFANGGDRKKNNTPEMDLCEKIGIQMMWAVGGNNKPQSSSWLVNKLKENKNGSK